jgi:hypothetical protein
MNQDTGYNIQDASLQPVIMKKQKPLHKSLRKPLPQKTGGFHSTPKGKKGYNRKNSKKVLKKEMESI